MRIIKSINTANLSTVSIQGDLLTTTAIACFNRLKAKCSYCICQTRQERSMLFLCQENGSVHGGSQLFLIPPSLKPLNPVWNFLVNAQMFYWGENNHTYIQPGQNMWLMPQITLMTFARVEILEQETAAFFFPKYSSGSQNAELQHVLVPKSARRSSELLGHLSTP